MEGSSTYAEDNLVLCKGFVSEFGTVTNTKEEPLIEVIMHKHLLVK